jgi:O-antigen/teichoic acid export membrane protein
MGQLKFRVPFRDLLKHKLVLNTGIYTLGALLQRFGAFLLIPLYTRYLSPEEYGIAGLVLTAGSVLTAILGLGIYGSVTRYFFDYHGEELKSYISTTILFYWGFLFIVFVMLTRWGAGLWDFVTSGQIAFYPIVALMLWAVFGDLLGQVQLSLYQVQQRAAQYILAQWGRFLLITIASIFYIVALQRGAIGQITGTVIGALCLGAVLAGITIKRYWTRKIRFQFIKQNLVYGLPLVPHLAAQWAKVYVDRFILERNTTLGDLGLYSLVSTIALGLVILAQSINQAYAPFYFDIMSKSDATELRIVKIIVSIAIILSSITMAGVVFSRQIIFLLAPPDYQNAAHYLPMVMFGALLNGFYYLFVNPLFYFKKTNLLPWVTGGSVALGFASNLFAIPRWRLWGAVGANLFTQSIILVVIYLASQKVQRLSFPIKRIMVLVGIVFSASIYSGWGYLRIDHMIDLFIKLSYLATFGVLAWVLLIRPYFSFRRLVSKSVEGCGIL